MKKQITAVLAISLMSLSCSTKTEEHKVAAQDKFCINKNLKSRITIEPVTLLPVEENIALTGKVSYNADQVVQFSSLIDGVVTATYFSLGDYVKKDQVLAEVKSTALNSLVAEQEAFTAQLEAAKRELEAVQSLFNDGVASQSEVLKAKSEVSLAASSLNNVKQNLALFCASKDRSVFYIKAPVAGYIVGKNMSPGTQIAAGNDPLFTISGLDEVWVMVNVYSVNINDVKKGMEVAITSPAYPGETFNGKIDEMAQVFDDQEHVVKARIVMQNKDLKLKPGMQVDVAISTKRAKKEMPAVPADALIFDNNTNYLVVYHNDCDVEIRHANPTVKGSKYLYFDLLKPGEKIITKNQLLVFEQLKK